MIAYGSLSSRKNFYPKREMTVGINAIQSIKVDGEFGLDQSDVFSRTVLSATEEPHLWSDFCQILVSEFPGTQVVLFPLESQSGTPYSSAPLSSLPALPTKGTLALLSAQKKFEFVAESIFGEHDKNQHIERPLSYVGLLDFGLDGSWILRIRVTTFDDQTAAQRIELLNGRSTAIALAAATSSRLLIASIKAQALTFQQIGQPFAILDEELRIIIANENFETIFSSLFQNSLGTLAPTLTQNAKSLRQAVVSFLKRGDRIETILQNDRHPCVAVLHKVAADRYRISGKQFIGLEIKGALPAVRPDSKLLAGLFGLTQREADVVALLSSGKSVGAVASDHAVSVGTVRVQLKAIFRKMGVAGQVELVSKVLSARF